MNRVTKKIVLLIAVVGVFATLLLEYLYHELHIVSRMVYKVTINPLGFLSLSLLATSVVLFFVREQVFYTWRNFAFWWVPFSLLLTVLVGNGERGSFGLGSLIDSEFVAMFMAVLFFLISVVLVIYKSYSLRSK